MKGWLKKGTQGKDLNPVVPLQHAKIFTSKSAEDGVGLKAVFHTFNAKLIISSKGVKFAVKLSTPDWASACMN